MKENIQANYWIAELFEKNIQINETTQLVKTNFLQTMQRNKSLINRLRRLYNVLTKMNKIIVQKLRSFNAQDLTNFFHCFRDSFNIDYWFFVNLFW